MSFEFTVLPDERFVEILEPWVDLAQNRRSSHAFRPLRVGACGG